MKTAKNAISYIVTCPAYNVHGESLPDLVLGVNQSTRRLEFGAYFHRHIEDLQFDSAIEAFSEIRHYIEQTDLIRAKQIRLIEIDVDRWRVVLIQDENSGHELPYQIRIQQ